MAEFKLFYHFTLCDVYPQDGGNNTGHFLKNFVTMTPMMIVIITPTSTGMENVIVSN